MRSNAQDEAHSFLPNERGEIRYKQLVITGIESGTKSLSLKKLLMKYGKVISVKIYAERRSNVCYGLVKMEAEAAERSIQALNGIMYAGRVIRIDEGDQNLEKGEGEELVVANGEDKCSSDQEKQEAVGNAFDSLCATSGFALKQQQKGASVYANSDELSSSTGTEAKRRLPLENRIRLHRPWNYRRKFGPVRVPVVYRIGRSIRLPSVARKQRFFNYDKNRGNTSPLNESGSSDGVALLRKLRMINNGYRIRERQRRMEVEKEHMKSELEHIKLESLLLEQIRHLKSLLMQQSSGPVDGKYLRAEGSRYVAEYTSMHRRDHCSRSRDMSYGSKHDRKRSRHCHCLSRPLSYHSSHRGRSAKPYDDNRERTSRRLSGVDNVDFLSQSSAFKSSGVPSTSSVEDSDFEKPWMTFEQQSKGSSHCADGSKGGAWKKYMSSDLRGKHEDKLRRFSHQY